MKPSAAPAAVQIRLIYDGIGPVHWCRDPRGFGIQDKDGTLHPGQAGPNGTAVFDLSFQVKANAAGAPVLSGDFAHGPPAARFLYLGWRDSRGAFAQRLKLSLATITWDDVREADACQQPLQGTLIDQHPKAASTGANIGGSRPIRWVVVS